MNKDDLKVEDKEGGVSISVQELVDKMTDKIAAAIVEKKGGNSSDQQQLAQKIFSPQMGMKSIPYPSDLQNLTKDEKIVLFFKSLVMRAKDPYSQDHDRVFKALVEGTDSEGGYLVPEEFRSEVFRVLPDVTVMRRVATILPMNTDTLNLNTLTARPTAYWTAEYGSKTTTSAEFGRLVLSPNDLVCLLPVTHQLLNDANINMVQFITQLFAEAIGLAEDKAFFTGSGVGQPKGINQESIPSADAGGSVEFNDVIGLLDLVTQRITQSPGAAFVANRRVKTILRQVKDTTGAYIWRDGGAAQSNVGETKRLPDMLYGYPFYEQNNLSQTELYFGDWKNYIIGDRQQMVVETTNVGGEAWRRNAMEIKAVERVDGKAILPSQSFAKLTNVR